MMNSPEHSENNTKPNLVIVHSYPTNSHILSGLYAYLADHFTVYAIDLPGFTANNAPIMPFTLESYSQYIDEKLSLLNLDQFWLCGVSFGFRIINLCQHPNCLGYMGILPYINRDYLVVPSIAFKVLQWSVSFICHMKIHDLCYRSRWFRQLLRTETTDERIDEILASVDARSFFEIGRWLSSHNSLPTFHDKPYIFIVNPDDQTVKGDMILPFLNQAQNKLIVRTTADHHPDDLSKSYFAKHLSEKNASRILTFMHDHQNQKARQNTHHIGGAKRVSA